MMMPSIVSFFLWQPVHRVLLLLLLACHETCECSFCFCLHEFLKNFILLCDGWIGRVGIWSMENYSGLHCDRLRMNWIYFVRCRFWVFTRAWILSYMPKCVCIVDLIYWIYLRVGRAGVGCSWLQLQQPSSLGPVWLWVAQVAQKFWLIIKGTK